MKRVFLCAVLAGACSSRASGLPDFDSGVPADGAGAVDRGVVFNDTPAIDVPMKGRDVPAAVDLGFPEDVPVAVDLGFRADIPAPMDLGPACQSDRECSAAGLVCDLMRAACVECVRTEDCLVAGQRCSSNRCVAGLDAGPPTDTGTPTDRGTTPTDRGTTLTDMGVRPDAGPGATLLTGLGGVHGFGPPAQCLLATDDGSWGAELDGGVRATSTAIPLGTGFSGGLLLGARRFPSFYLNNNGNISFGALVTTYTGETFPVTTTTPIIAPWWADVDTRGGGQPSRNQVCFVNEPSRLVVTWYDVGYYSSHTDRLNSFQLILTPAGAAGSGDFDAEFRYARCQWTTGDVSGGTGGLGGTPAQAGFDFGDRTNFLALPYSRSPDMLYLCTTSNGATPGVWRFQVRSGAPRHAS